VNGTEHKAMSDKMNKTEVKVWHEMPFSATPSPIEGIEV